MVNELPRLKKVAAGKDDYTLRVTWANNKTDTIDMTGVIFRHKAFYPLRDPTRFRDVKPIAHNWAIGWGDGEELDYPSEALERLAIEQRPMTGKDFRNWQMHFKLSIPETAKILGLSDGTVKNYRNRRWVPTTVQIACTAMVMDPIILAAHYRPRKAGRPRKVA
jgi:hypothetical protein